MLRKFNVGNHFDVEHMNVNKVNILYTKQADCANKPTKH